jgi:hypothetical protein
MDGFVVGGIGFGSSATATESVTVNGSSTKTDVEDAVTAATTVSCFSTPVTWTVTPGG